VPPLSGFFSKDEILGAGLAQGPLHPLGGLVLAGVAGLTAFYMLRAFLITFMGSSQLPGQMPHEAGSRFIAPLVVLAALAWFGGLVQPFGFWHLLGDYLNPVFHGEAQETAGSYAVGAMALGLLAILGGMLAAYALYGRAPQVRAARPQPAVLERAFFWDAVYDRLVVRPVWAFAGLLDQLVEARLIAGATDAAAGAALLAGRQVRRLQSGYLRSYAMAFAAAALLIVVAAAVGIR
jgi:NADH-quinone oxidoreductase subunit L